MSKKQKQEEPCNCDKAVCNDECDEILYHETVTSGNELQELKDKLLRTNAELINYRRRKEEETSNLLKYQYAEFAKNLLPIVDDFERAVSLDDDNLDDELSKFLVGFKMIFGNLASLLNNYEIKEIKALRVPFNPEYHHAVLTDNNPEIEDNLVTDVMQKGYMYKDKVLRPAMVRVNKLEKEKEN